MEGFLHSKAVTYEKADISRTYLFWNSTEGEKTGQIVFYAYFTITQKVFSFASALTDGQRRKLAGIFYKNEEAIGYLVGQVGKNHALLAGENPVHLDDILSSATEKIYSVYEQIGGRFIFLDCKATNTKVCEMYKKSGFIPFQDIVLDGKGAYHQMVKLLHS